MDRAPCKDCEKRYVGCHSDCIDYKDWKKAHDAFEGGKRWERQINTIMHDSQSRRCKSRGNNDKLNHCRQAARRNDKKT